jgi:hypothetical protein
MSVLYPCIYCTEDGHCKKFSDEEVASWCVLGPCEYEKPSIADRIRAMSDEKLAEWLGYIGDAHCEPNAGWLDWLKREADDERICQD